MMPSYVKLTRVDGAELHMPTPFPFAGSADGRDSIVYLGAGNGLPVKETPEQIAMLLGIGRAEQPARDATKAATRLAIAERLLGDVLAAGYTERARQAISQFLKGHSDDGEVPAMTVPVMLAPDYVVLSGPAAERTIEIERRARAVVGERYRPGSEWNDLSSRIGELAEIVGGGSMEDQQQAERDRNG
jgi:hypothetical protein